MVTRSLFPAAMAVVLVVLWLGSARPLCSQEAPPSAVEQLEALKASNAALIQRQQKTLEKLDDMKKKANEMRLMISRA